MRPYSIVSNPESCSKSDEHPSYIAFFKAIGYQNDREIQIVIGKSDIYRGWLQSDSLIVSRCEVAGQLPCGGRDWQPKTLPTATPLTGCVHEDGVFFRPNRIEGGILERHFQGSDLLFYEIDNLPLDEQEAALDRFVKQTGFAPVAVVFSGGKSLHVYFRFSEELSAEDWKRLMRKLCVVQKSDAALVTLGRLMRLPGATRLKDGEWKEQKLISVNPDAIHSAYEFEAALDATGLFPYGITEDRFRGWKRDRHDDPKLDESHKSRYLHEPDSVLYPPTPKIIPNSFSSEVDDNEILEALSFIPRRKPGKGISGNYEDSLAVLIALKSLYGDSKAEAIAENWSPSEPGWDIARELRSLGSRKKDAEPVGVIFGIAKRYDYMPKKRSAKKRAALTEKSRLGSESGASDAQPTAMKESVGAGKIQIPLDVLKKNAKLKFPQVAAKELYTLDNDRWICVTGDLYRWTGTYYKRSDDETELARIQKLADSHTGTDKEGNLTFPFASPSAVRQALEWIKMSFAVPLEKCNPTGLNCTNGVLRITYTGDRGNLPEFELVPHNPDFYYLYEPMATYDPLAPTEDCDRLMDALDKPQQEILLKVVSSALDIETVRKIHGRGIKALLVKGLGSNGKDSHREAVSLLFGRSGLTSASLQDFQQYDDGRKFPLAKLATSRINWASENKKGISLDDLQSLKQAITGEEMDFEGKGKDEKQFCPKAVMLFNLNDTPTIKAGMNAIESRFAVLSYNKVYAASPDSTRGEMQADPRYKYDPDFIKNNVLSAFLNRVIAAFIDLMQNGIDYSPCQDAMQEIQIQNSHLFEFAKDVGLKADRGSVIPVKELWALLEQYYIDIEALSIDMDGKRSWADDVRPGDPYVKGANQVAAKLIKLFPQCKLVEIGYRQKGIKGIALEATNTPEIKTSASQFDEVQITETVQSQDLQAIAAQPKKELQKGDRVIYTGANENFRDQYSGILTIHKINPREGACCWAGEDRLTTWLPIKELKRVEAIVEVAA